MLISKDSTRIAVRQPHQSACQPRQLACQPRQHAHELCQPVPFC